MKKRSFLWLTGMFILATSLFVSCSDDDANGLNEPNGGSENSKGTPIKPIVNTENLKFVGRWSGNGPYMASGVSSYGIVKGEWEFYNDGTYHWEGSNTFGYTYRERGKWHYNTEQNILITDGSCNLIWQIEETSDNAWTGTILNKNQIGTYSRLNDKNISIGNIRIIDYKKESFVIRDTITNHLLYNEEFKCGVCYGEDENFNIHTSPKIYANNVYTDTIGTISQYNVIGLYDITLKGLNENGKYQLCSFIELNDGTIIYGKTYNAICITPPENSIYLGEEPIPISKYSNIKTALFWSRSAIKEDGTFEESVSAYTHDFLYEETAPIINNLGDGWSLPSSSDFSNLLTTMYNREISKNEKGKLNLITIRSNINGNYINFRFLSYLNFLNAASISNEYMMTSNFWTCDMQKNKPIAIRFYNSEKGSETKIGTLHMNSTTVYTNNTIRPCYTTQVTW